MFGSSRDTRKRGWLENHQAKRIKKPIRFVMRRMLLIIGKSNHAFRKLGFFVENKGSAMHRTFRGS